jgi:non-ribosomal peptide synthetase component F
VLAGQVDWWRQQLAGAPGAIRLPFGRAGGRQGARAALRLHLALEEELSNRIRRFARERNITSHIILLAAFKALLYTLTSETDLVIGAVISGRHYPEVQATVGPFINMVPLRTRLHGQLSFVDLLSRVWRTQLDALEFAKVPFEKIVEAVRPPGADPLQPLFRIAFGLNMNDNFALDLKGCELTAAISLPAMVRYDLSVWIVDRLGTFHVQWSFDPDQYDAADIDSMHRRYEILITRAMHNPHESIDAMNDLSDQEMTWAMHQNAQRRASNHEMLRSRRRINILGNYQLEDHSHADS